MLEISGYNDGLAGYNRIETPRTLSRVVHDDWYH